MPKLTKKQAPGFVLGLQDVSDLIKKGTEKERTNFSAFEASYTAKELYDHMKNEMERLKAAIDLKIVLMIQKYELTEEDFQ